MRVYLEHRQIVVKRRSEYDLNKAHQRAHILEGLRVAINNFDQVIAIIRGSTDVDQARTKLIKQFKLVYPGAGDFGYAAETPGVP